MQQLKIKVLWILCIIAGVLIASQAEVKGQQDNSGESVYFMADQMPEFPGGAKKLQKHIKNHLNYPEKAKKQGISGTVYVKFVVDTNGEITQVEVNRGVHPLLDEAAKKVVKNLPKWKPGKKDGKLVSVSQAIPVKFEE